MGSNPSKVTRGMLPPAKEHNGTDLCVEWVRQVTNYYYLARPCFNRSETVPADTSSGGAQEYRGYQNYSKI